MTVLKSILAAQYGMIAPIHIQLPDSLSFPEEMDEKSFETLTIFLKVANDNYRNIELLDQGYQLIRRLLELTPNHTSLLVVYSFYLYVKTNPELALVYVGRALLFKPNFLLAQELFARYRRSFNIEESAEVILNLAAANVEEHCEYLTGKAKLYFDQHFYHKSDTYTQRAVAVRYELPLNLSVEQAISIANKKIESIGYEQLLSDWHETQRSHIAFHEPSTSGLVDAQHWDARWLGCPNKNQLANCVANILTTKFDTNSISYVELGCHMGGLMHLMEEACKQKEISLQLYGIDPDPVPITTAIQKYPHMTFIQGDSDDMVSNRCAALPEQIDLLVLSQICLLLLPNELDCVFEFASRRCRCVIVYDDLANFDGELSIPRRRYLLHPFQKMLLANNLHVKEMQYAVRPTIGMNGIFSAFNPNLSTALPGNELGSDI